MSQEMHNQAAEAPTDMSWSENMAYTQTRAADDNGERYENFGATRDSTINGGPVSSTGGGKNDSGVHGAGLHPVLRYD
jgi:hypothetical protein